jgi:hypothetical protein
MKGVPDNEVEVFEQGQSGSQLLSGRKQYSVVRLVDATGCGREAAVLPNGTMLLQGAAARASSSSVPAPLPVAAKAASGPRLSRATSSAERMSATEE